MLREGRYNQESWYQRRFEDVFLRFKPDIVIIIQGKPVFSVLKFNRATTHFIGWWIEPSDQEDEILRNSQGFDDYFSYSKKTVNILVSRGVRARYMPHAFNPRIFFQQKNEKVYDIVFVGAWSPWRDEVLKKVFDLTKNIRIFGPKWASRSTIPKSVLMAAYGGEYLSESAVNELYSQAKIVLNASRTHMSSGLNLRFFEVLATSTLLLSDTAPEIGFHFQPGRDLMVFDSLDDLGVKVTHLLADKELRGQIAGSGYRIVYTDHSYSSLASRLIDQCSVFHSEVFWQPNSRGMRPFCS
jgi:spore maturation protein CgeB